MNKRRKLKLAIASACAAEQISSLNPISLDLLQHPQTHPQSQAQADEEEDQDEQHLFLHTAALSCLANLNLEPPAWWVKPRLNPAWFDKFILEVHDRETWLQTLRMSKQTFFWICNQLQPLLSRKVTRFRDPIPVPCRLAAALYRFTSGADLQVISEKFGIGVSSSASCITDTVKAINQHFQSRISFPKGDEVIKVATGFSDKCELVNCVGAVGRGSVRVTASSGLDTSGCSISVQAVVDTGYRFLDVVCGGGPELVTGELVGVEAGVDVRYLVGDDGFPLLPWLLVQYREDTEMPIMAESFNRRHAAGVLHVRAAFGILKDTFKILSRCVKHNAGFVPSLVSACCILHNILLDRDEIPMDSFLQGMLSDEGGGEDCQDGYYEDPQGVELRDQLAEMFVRRDLFKA